MDADAVRRGEEADRGSQDRADRATRAQVEGDQPDRRSTATGPAASLPVKPPVW